MIELLIGPVTGLLDKFVEDKDQKAKLAHEIATLAERQAHEIAKSQIAVNKEEASSHSMFVAGWRPAVGWVCTLGLATNYLFVPICNFLLTITESPITVPPLDLSEMMPVLLGMLGLGGLRTYEKTKDVARK
jgi:phenylpyruvate tautomerase PptA (4-oxalocrotonate tautomerase family)